MRVACDSRDSRNIKFDEILPLCRMRTLYVPIHPSSRKYLRFAFELKQGLSVSGTSLCSEHSPSDFTQLGHTVTGYLHHLGISVIPYLDDWLVHHPDCQVLLRHQAQLLETLDLVGFILNRKKSELDLVQDIQFLRIRLCLDSGEALLPESKAWEIVAGACDLSFLGILSSWVHSVGPQVLSLWVVCT